MTNDWDAAWEAVRQRVGPEPGPVHPAGTVLAHYRCGCSLLLARQPNEVMRAWLKRTPCPWCDWEEDDDE